MRIKLQSFTTESVSHSDLFGVEDEDFRSVQQQLPLKSPSSKGWDQYKEGKDEYAYDRELKKQREDTGVPPRGHR